MEHKTEDRTQEAQNDEAKSEAPRVTDKATKPKRGKTKKAKAKRKSRQKRSKRTKRKAGGNSAARTRTARPYPASSFNDALPLGNAIMKHAAGDKVRRLTLLQQMDKSPTSSATQMLITNSGKYGITKGSYAAEHLELTDKGRLVVDPANAQGERRRAAFELAIASIRPFSAPFVISFLHFQA